MELALLIIIVLLAIVMALGILILFGLRNINVRLDELSTLNPPSGASAAIPTFKAISSSNRDISDSATMVDAEVSDEEQSRLQLQESVLEVQEKLGKTSRVAVEDLIPAQPFRETPDDTAPMTVPCPNCSYLHVIDDLAAQRRYVCPECRTPIEIEDD